MNDYAAVDDDAIESDLHLVHDNVLPDVLYPDHVNDPVHLGMEVMIGLMTIIDDLMMI